MGLRSNRPLTQFVCDQIDRCLKGRATAPFELEKGNTRVACSVDHLLNVFKVYLCDQEILSVLITNKSLLQQSLQTGANVYSIRVSIGENLTLDGYPRKTTVERLNGILDKLSDYNVIPVDVRLYKHREQDTYALGKGDDYIAVGQRAAKRVIITPNANQLILEAAQ